MLGVMDLNNLVQLVYEHIGTASIGNVLKIRQKFSFKEGDEGLPPEEFCEKFIQFCVGKVSEGVDAVNTGKLISRTVKFQKDLKLNGRKDSLMDIYLLDLRRIRRSFIEWEKY